MTTPHAMSPTARRSSWPWVIAGAVVVVAAVVVTLALTAGDGAGTGSAAVPSTTAGPDQPGALDTPEGAAASFVAAARTGSGDKLLGLACVGRPACVHEHAAEVTGAQLTEAQDTIREGVYELAVHLEGAEFSSAVAGVEPGTKDVPYRTPAMTGDAYLTLTFIRSDGDWLYFVPDA